MTLPIPAAKAILRQRLGVPVKDVKYVYGFRTMGGRVLALHPEQKEARLWYQPPEAPSLPGVRRIPPAIWSRWCSYVASGHGGNVELRALVSDPTLDYCRKAFRFALLEYRPSPTPDEVILAREAFWKRILLTRGDYGLNRN